MKRNGKYEGKKQAVDASKKQVKSLLLQTYFTSLLSLVLCVSMFFGTSYAWFTSEVTSSNNEIYVGTLKVGLSKIIPETNGVTELDLINSDHKLFDGSFFWEPGYTALEKICIKNKGNLAFNYVMNFTDGEIKEGEAKSLDEVAKHFDVWIYNHAENTQREYRKPTNYSQISEANGWENLGTLDKLLAGEVLLSNKLVTDDQAKRLKEAGKEGEFQHYYTIAMHMKENADASVMGHKIGLNVKLVAYQMASETDDLGNTNYDNIAVVSNAEDLKKALDNVPNIVPNVLLNANITIGDSANVVTLRGGTLDGNRNTISYQGDKVSGSPVGVLNVNGGNISNLTIKGENGIALQCTNLTSDLVANNCTFEGANAFYLNSAVESSHSIFFNDCNFKAWVSYNNMIEHVYFNNCSFASTLKPDCNTTLTDCTLTFECLDVSAGVEIKLINCTYKDIKIDNAIVTKNGIEGTNAIKIVDGKVVLSNT